MHEATVDLSSPSIALYLQDFLVFFSYVLFKSPSSSAHAWLLLLLRSRNGERLLHMHLESINHGWQSSLLNEVTQKESLWISRFFHLFCMSCTNSAGDFLFTWSITECKRDGILLLQKINKKWTVTKLIKYLFLVFNRFLLI